ncbi:hypothetical protein [Bartonella sp. CB60]|uniref:hypothetical protein n=1 Tax=Bartonella sp. CB60 TaxID=3113619 RepID=UPI00300E5069
MYENVYEIVFDFIQQKIFIHLIILLIFCYQYRNMITDLKSLLRHCMEITLKIDDDKIQDLMYQLQEPRLQRTLVNAVNATATALKRKSTSLVIEKLGLSKENKNRVAKEINVTKKATANEMNATVTGDTNRLPLRIFSHQEQLQNGTIIKISGEDRMYRGAFHMGGKFPNRTPLKVGGGNIFKQSESKTRRIKSKNGTYLGYGIRKVKGISVTNVLEKSIVQEKLSNYNKDILEYNVVNKLNKEIDKI